MTAAALVASAAHGAPAQRIAVAPRGAAATAHQAAGDRPVQAPVRIADAAAVTLLHPGDRVDVLAGARVVAVGVKVIAVPEGLAVPTTTGAFASDSVSPGGALIVLSVSRRTAAALSGAAASSPLGVTLC